MAHERKVLISFILALVLCYSSAQKEEEISTDNSPGQKKSLQSCEHKLLAKCRDIVLKTKSQSNGYQSGDASCKKEGALVYCRSERVTLTCGTQWGNVKVKDQKPGQESQFKNDPEVCDLFEFVEKMYPPFESRKEAEKVKIEKRVDNNDEENEEDKEEEQDGKEEVEEEDGEEKEEEEDGEEEEEE